MLFAQVLLVVLSQPLTEADGGADFDADGGVVAQAPHVAVAPFVLRGRVVGALGEPLPGAQVKLEPKSAVTDEKGAFSITLDQPFDADTWVSVVKPGYALKAFPEVFQPGRIAEVRYVLPKERVSETLIRGSRLLPAVPDADRTPQVSHYSFNRTDIDRTPGALEDIARVVQSLPGVAADPDLLASFFVRGGAPDEVLFMIDGVPLSNPFHLGGFASIINPQLVESADFYAGGSPARYEPTLSGTLEVHYPKVEATKFHVVADLSIQTAKIRADIPLGIEGLSAVVGFRRSYFELYFAALKALNVFGQNVVAPDITEVFARVIFHRGKHRTLATFINASDGVNFVIKPGEEVLVNFAGGLKLQNNALIASLSHAVDLGGDSELSVLGAFTRDTNAVNISSERSLVSDAENVDVLFRADAKIVHSDAHRTSLGVQYAWRRLQLTGSVSDSRAQAPWAQIPIIDTYLPALPIAPSRTQNLIAVYGEHTWKIFERFTVEAGLRGQVDVSHRQVTGSGRLAASLVLPTLTVLKASTGFALQPVASPLLLDAQYGNPALLPQRSVNLVIGAEQPLPFEALLKVEGWSKWLSALAVNPDTRDALDARLAAGLPAYQSLGTGTAYGLDLIMVGRVDHFAYTFGLGIQRAHRTNPLAVGLQEYRVEWEQPVSAAASLTWSPNSKWVFTGRANFRTGRPYTPVASFISDFENQRFVPVFGPTSSATFPFFFELSFRGEYRFKAGPLSCAVYLEALNVTNTMNVFTYIYDKGDYAGGMEPNRQAFNHLPIRPFLGIRAEY